MLKAIERIIVKILPYAIYRFLGGFYGVFIKRNSYSQYGEDLIILEFFKKQKKQFKILKIQLYINRRKPNDD